MEAGWPGQIRHQRPKLTVGSCAVGLAEPVVQLLEVDAALAGGYAQLLGDGLPVRVRRPGRIGRAARSR